MDTATPTLLEAVQARMGVICPYCGKPSVLQRGDELYPGRADLSCRRFFVCVPCQAWVGCHHGTVNPLGSLADGELRKARSMAHNAFDPLWQGQGSKQRRVLYSQLAKGMGLDTDSCHIAQFNVARCQQVVAICYQWSLL